MFHSTLPTLNPFIGSHIEKMMQSTLTILEGKLNSRKNMTVLSFNKDRNKKKLKNLGC